MAIEAVVTCTEAERAMGQMAKALKTACALFPAIGALHPGGGDMSLAHVLQTAAAGAAGAGGCLDFARTTATHPGVYPGGGRIQRRSRGPQGV